MTPLSKQQLDQLYRYCYILTTDRESAYDLLQIAMKKHVENPIRQSAVTLPYIRRIIRHQFIDNARGAKCVVFESIKSTNTIALDTMTLDNIIVNAKLVDMAWSTLNVAEREIMYLCSVEKYTAAEIATATKVSRGAVLSRIYRIRHKVVEAFKQQDRAKRESRVMEE